VTELARSYFDFLHLPANHTCGGILLAWHTDHWVVSCPLLREFSLIAKVCSLTSDETWWMTCVYGPHTEADKLRFLQELREVRANGAGDWLLCGDFNLIYKAEDKSNGLLN
jgi:hypothetical protein